MTHRKALVAVGSFVFIITICVKITRTLKSRHHDRVYHATPTEFKTIEAQLGGFKDTFSDQGNFEVNLGPNLDHVWYYFEKVSFSFRSPVYLVTDDSSVLVPKAGDLVYLNCNHLLVNDSDTSLIHRGKVYK